MQALPGIMKTLFVENCIKLNNTVDTDSCFLYNNNCTKTNNTIKAVVICCEDWELKRNQFKH